MKGNLIKINNDFVLVTELNGEPKEGELFLTNENVIHSNIGYNYGDRLITHSTNDNHNVGKLSFKNCQEIEIGYDLEELSENVYREYPTESKNSGFEYNRDRHVFKKRKAFIKGFEKCLELIGDKKFSKEDIRKSILMGRISDKDHPPHPKYSIDEIIESVQTKEWDVEILMGTNYRHIDCVDMGDLVKSKIVKDNEAPMLDKDGCLILKRI